MSEPRPFRPSNGSHGEWFITKFCVNCDREGYLRTGNDRGLKCEILTASMIHKIDDPGYPKEWIEDGGGPRCTAFVPVGTASKKAWASRRRRLRESCEDLFV